MNLGKSDQGGVPDAEQTGEEPPPLLKTWKNLYLLVVFNLVLWIILFTLFTWIFE